MARMHTRRKGRSGSSPQTRKENPKWSPKAKDVEKLVIELSAEGKSSSEIGIILRDTHGVPSVKLATGKSISKILGYLSSILLKSGDDIAKSDLEKTNFKVMLIISIY